ncbi:MAG: rhomboid family intramembrane serine protease [Myxococcota bacterium]
MFVPIGDEPNPRGVPWVNYLLIAINVAVYALITLPLSMQAPDTSSPLYAEYVRILLQAGEGRALPELLSSITAYDLFVLEHGYRPAQRQWMDILTAMFLHANFFHLAGNMLFLWIYGDNVEARLGKLGYLASYLLTGVLGTWTHDLVAGPSPVPSLGASGAISGVLGFYFVFFPHNTVRMLVALFPFFMDVIRIRARVVLAFYLVLDNVIPFVLTSSATGVAYGAHIGGFVGGLVVGWMLGSREPGGALAARPRLVEGPVREVGPEHPAQLIRDMVDHGEVARAVGLYSRIWDTPAQQEVDPADALDIADWLAGQGNVDAALAVYRRLLSQGLTGSLAARAHLGAGLALLKEGRATAAYQHLVTAQEHGPDHETRRGIEEALQVIREMQKFRFRGR